VTYLGRRIAPEIADTGSPLIYHLSQGSGRNPSLARGQVAVLPVLAEQAVEGTGLIKNGQILISIFGARPIGIARKPTSGTGRTHPFSHTIGGQRVIIPGQIAGLRIPTL